MDYQITYILLDQNGSDVKKVKILKSRWYIVEAYGVGSPRRLVGVDFRSAFLAEQFCSHLPGHHFFFTVSGEDILRDPGRYYLGYPSVVVL